MSDLDEIADYYIWHPRREPDGRIALDITSADKTNPPSLTDTFLGPLAQRLGVRSEMQAVQITAARSQYFSDEEAKDWKDIWPMIWTLTFALENPTEELPPWQDEFLTFVGYDPSTLDLPPSDSTLALIYADFETSEDAQAFETTLSDDADVSDLLRNYKVEHPYIVFFPLYDFLTRARIVIGPVSQEFFRSQNPLTEAIFAAVSNCNGYNTFEERCLEYEEYFDPEGLG